MSPTIFREGPYRFFFFSREERRPHVHVTCPEGEAKFWLEPEVGLAVNSKLSAHQIQVLHRMVEEHFDEIMDAWREHFEH